MRTLIKKFKEISKSDAQIAGGKGASLGEMTNAGIPVPPGFVVLAEAFEQFLAETDLNVEIEAILKTVDNKKIHTVENAPEKIQALILEAKMPEDIEKEIEKNFKKLDARFVAVRSSATAEDGAEAAWAGQLESYLNTTQNSLQENVQKCWASLFTPRAIFYRFEKKLHNQKISVAVVIQKMIQSEISGIAFSVHPVTEDYNQMIIEAGFGLGEAIVSGSITPDSYVVSKNPRKIEDINISQQSKGLFKKADGGNVWQDIPENEGKKQKLTKQQILELADLIVKIEDHYQFPVDIEWAFEKNKFYIVQSRPITTLMKSSNQQQEYRQLLNRAMSLAGCELYDLSERVELPKICDNVISFDPIIYHQPGRGHSVFYNFTDPKQNIADLVKFFNKHEKRLIEIKKIFDDNCNKIRGIIKRKEARDIKRLFNLLKKVWPLIVVSNILGDDSRENVFGVRRDLVRIYIRVRKESDDVLHFGQEALDEMIKKSVPKKYQKWVEFLKYSEVAGDKLPEIKELDLRRAGYIYHKGKLYKNQTLEEFSAKNNFLIKMHKDNFNLDEIGNEIRGRVAFEGIVRGVVKLVFEKKDIKKVQKGDIMVAPMTTPEFVTAMKKAAGFVTDEGGITCHAAIVAREMAKPCIIGTKIATEILQDGDFVEVDADKGVVRVLEKGKSGFVG